MKTLPLFLIVSTAIAACGAPTEEAESQEAPLETSGTDDAEAPLGALFERTLKGTLDIPRTGREDLATLAFNPLGLYELREPMAMGGYYVSERGAFTVDAEQASLTLDPNGGGATRVYSVTFSLGQSNGSYTPSSVVLRSDAGAFRLKGMVADQAASLLPGSTLAPLDAFAQQLVGEARGTIDIPRTNREDQARLVFTEDGLYELREPKAMGGYVTTDRGAWVAQAGASPETGTLTLIGNMGSGTRSYEVTLAEDGGRTVAVLRSAAGTFMLTLR